MGMNQQAILILPIAVNAMGLQHQRLLPSPAAVRRAKKYERHMLPYLGLSVKVKASNNAKGSTTRRNWKRNVIKDVG